MIQYDSSAAAGMRDHLNQAIIRNLAVFCANKHFQKLG